MEYTMRIYCCVPESIKITEQMKRSIRQNDLVIGGFVEVTFGNRDALFHYVRGYDYVNTSVIDLKKKKIRQRDLYRVQYIPGALGNHILDATMTHPNDSLRHKH